MDRPTNNVRTVSSGAERKRDSPVAEAGRHSSADLMQVVRGAIYDYPKYYELLFGSDWRAEFGFLRACFEKYARRRERVVMTVDVHTPSRRFRLAEEMIFRTYTARQFRCLLDRIRGLELVETYDFAYDVGQPVRVNEETTDVVCVLRKR
jgi:hypothetical protein